MPIDNTITVNDNLYNTFYDFIIQFLPDENIFLLDSDFIAPQGPYTALKVVKFDPMSPRGNTSDDATSTTTSSLYMGYVMLRCFGRHGFARALSISHHLKDAQLKAELRTGGFGYSAHSNVSDDSVAIDDQQTEERGTLTVMGHVVLSNDQTTIESIDVINTPHTIT